MKHHCTAFLKISNIYYILMIDKDYERLTTLFFIILFNKKKTSQDFFLFLYVNNVQTAFIKHNFLVKFIYI